MGFADPALIFQAWLLDQFEADKVVTGVHTERPSNIASTMPLIVLDDLGATDGTVGLERPRIAVEVFAAGRDAGMQLAGRVHDRVTAGLRNVTTSDGHVLTWTGGARFRRLPYPSRSQIWLFGTTYQFTLHARRAAS